jgi:phage head maturation protease
MSTPRFNVQVKSYAEEDAHPNGSFEAILSTSALDRDGEIIDPYAFDPLPASLPIFVDHAQWDTKSLVGRAVPSYDGQGRLVLRGFYGSDPFSQEIRQKVMDGLLDSMSVGFHNATRVVVAGVPHITKGEALEGSFVGVPANPEALVTASKSVEAADEETMTAEDTKSTETTTPVVETPAPVTIAPAFQQHVMADAAAIETELAAIEVMDDLDSLEVELDELDGLYDGPDIERGDEDQNDE